MANVSSIHEKPGMHTALDWLVRRKYIWKKETYEKEAYGLIGGWTMEQLGWPLTTEGQVIE